MKKIILATFLVITASAFVAAQTTAPTDVGTPAGAGDSNLQDNNIKLRAVELDRIRREANKQAVLRRDDGVELNFTILKSDFEGIQTSQSEIINAYQGSGEVDYKTMNKSAAKITEMAIRLKANLFPANPADKEEKNSDEKKSSAKAEAKSVRNLIVDLDNAVGELVSNTMFQNLKVIDPELGNKALLDVDKIIKFSSELWLETNKKTTK